MRDGDVREQTPIQSGTSKRGLLGNSGAHHHLRSPALGSGGEIKGGKNREKGDCPTGFTHITPLWVYYSGVWPERGAPASTEPTVCVHARCCESITSLCCLSKNTTSGRTYVCHASRVCRRNNKPSRFAHLKGMTFQTVARPQGLPNISESADAEMWDW